MQPINDMPVRLFLAILLPFLALGLQTLLWDKVEPNILFFFYPALFLSVTLCGLIGGFLTTLLSILLVIWFFIEPVHTLIFSAYPHGMALGMFAVMGFLFSYFNHRHQGRLAQAFKEKMTMESRYRTMFEQAPIGVALIDSRSGHIYDVNQRLAQLVGRSVMELLNTDWKEITHPDDVQEYLEHISKVNAGAVGSQQLIKRYLKHPGDEVVWVSITIAPITTRVDDPACHLCLVEDITERLAREKALLEARETAERFSNENRLTMLMQQSLVGVTEVDAQFRYIYVNDQFCKMLGYSREELLCKTIQDITYPDDCTGTISLLEALQEPGQYDIMEKRYIRKDGTPLWMRTAAGLFRNEADEVCSLMAMTVDINERKQAEQSLELAIEAGKMGIWHWDLLRDKVHWSDYMYQLFGVAAGTPLNYEKFLSILHPDDKQPVDAAVRKSLREQVDFEKEYRVIWQDGSEHWIMAVGRVYPGAHAAPEVMEGVIYDINDRKLAELELLEQKRQLAEAQRIAKIGSFIYDLNGRISWSSEAYRVWGVNPDSFTPTPKAIEALIYEEDCSLLTDWYQDCLAGKNPGPIVIRRFHPDGSLHYLSRQGELQYDAQGRGIRVTGTIQDITERYQTEQQLRESERRHGLALETLEIGEWELNLTARTAVRSLIHARIFGYAEPLPEWGIEHWMEHIVPEDRERIASAFEQARTMLSTIWDCEYRIRRIDGAIRWVHSRGFQHFNKNGQKLLTGIITDITERKQSELMLMQSEQRFRSLFEYLPIAYQSLDIDGRWLDANQKMADLIGFERPEDLFGLRFSDYWDASIQDQFHEKYEKFIQDHAIEGELLLHCRNDRLVTALISGRTQLDQEGLFVRSHCILLDVTERRALENQIFALNADLEKKVEERTAQLEAANAAKSQFLANMSHEIRTPMNGVLGLAQMLEHEALTPQQMAMVARILSAGRILLRIIDDILDYSKIEAGQLSLDNRAFKLSAVLSQIESLMGSKARSKALELRIDELMPVSGRLIGDAQRLEQVLINLVGNAVKFSERGEIVLRVSPVSVTGHKVRLRFEVKDSGIGMPPEVLNKLFTPFTQADNTITRRFGGTGLGLSICKRLVEIMGGAIGVESTDGVGSTFWFELPFDRVEDLVSVEKPKITFDGPRLAGLHVLVADDSQLNLYVAERILKREGAETTLVTDGQQVVDLLRENPDKFNAVLMDVQMPIMDGLTATRIIRQDLKLDALPIIAVTAGVMAEEKQKALDAGITDFLPKPMDLNRMVEIVQGLCR